MRRVLVAFLALLMLFGLVACSQDSPTAGTDTTETQKPQDTNDPEETQTTPTKDTVNLSLNKVLSSIDPHNTRTTEDVLVHGQMYEALYQLDEINGGYKARLATDYSVSDDGLTWTFDIRQGVKFHNGDTLTAKDVAFSYNRAKEAAVLQAFLAKVASVEAPDDYTFVVHLSQPVAAFLNQCTNVFIINEREVTEQGEEFGTKLASVGTGPYKMTTFVSSTGWSFDAFPDYWGGEAKIKHINYVVVSNTSAALIALENGELDFLTVAATDLSIVKDNAKFVIETVPANHVSYIFLNWMRGPLENDKVRYAIAHAIDKEAMNIAAFEGLAKVTDFMENPDYVYCAPTKTKSYEYNPELSKQLLAEAGYPDGVHVGVITVESGNYYEKMAQVLQAQLAEVGITVDLNIIESSTASSLFRVQDYDIGISGGTGQGDYAAFRQRVASTSKGSYYVKLEGDKFDYKAIDDLFDQGDASSDEAERKAIYEELNNRVMETACWLPIFHRIRPYVYAADLDAVAGHTNYYVYDWSWK